MLRERYEVIPDLALQKLDAHVGAVGAGAGLGEGTAAQKKAEAL